MLWKQESDDCDEECQEHERLKENIQIVSQDPGCDGECQRHKRLRQKLLEDQTEHNQDPGCDVECQ